MSVPCHRGGPRYIPICSVAHSNFAFSPLHSLLPSPTPPPIPPHSPPFPCPPYPPTPFVAPYFPFPVPSVPSHPLCRSLLPLSLIPTSISLFPPFPPLPLHFLNPTVPSDSPLDFAT